MDIDMNKIYIVPSNDKPVKLTVEFSDDNFTTEKRKPNDYEIYECIAFNIRLMSLRETITTQQYRVEKGKIRKGFRDEVLNFVKKRCIATHNNIINFINTEREYMIIKRKFGVNANLIDNSVKYGIYHT
jgi:hypothetical protein